MTKLRVLFLATLLVQSVGWANAQRPSSPPLKKSVVGVALIQRSLAAMRGSNSALLDSQATGTITFGSQSIHVLYKTHGASQVRVELDKSAGKSILIVNGGRGQVQQPKGSVRNLLHNNTYGQRVEHIPALSLLAENESSEVEVEDPAEEDVNGSKADVVTLSVVPAPDKTKKETDDYKKVSRTKFFLDKTSGYVMAIEYLNFAENDPDSASVTRTVFSDYRNINGIAVPFRQTTFIDGELFSDLVLDSVSFDVTWPAAEFELTAGVSHDR